MKFKMKVDGIHEREPAHIELEVEFESGEYLDVVKAMPEVIKQIKKTIKG